MVMLKYTEPYFRNRKAMDVGFGYSKVILF